MNNHKTRSLVRYHSCNKTLVQKIPSKWKIQLTMAINFISFNDSDETHTMHTKSNNVEIMMGIETEEIIEDPFQSFLEKYQEELEESMTRNEFGYDSADAMHYNLNKKS